MLVTGVRFPVCAAGGKVWEQNRRQGLACTLFFEQPFFTIYQGFTCPARNTPTRIQSDFCLFTPKLRIALAISPGRVDTKNHNAEHRIPTETSHFEKSVPPKEPDTTTEIF